MIAATVAIVATIALAALPVAQASEPINEPGALVAGTDHSCFFYYGAVGESENALGEKSNNIAYPDANAYYWAAYIRRPAGSKLVLHGAYPHARYMSLVTYNSAGEILDGVNDEMINPDAGSENPFREGVSRSIPNGERDYTVEMLSSERPVSLPVNHKAGEAPRNVLYSRAATDAEKIGAGATYETELVVLRIYVPDKGDSMLAGVSLPTPELTLSEAEGGETLTGQAACNKMDSESATRQAEMLANHETPTYRLPEPASLLLNAEIWHALSKPWALTKECNVAAQGVATCPAPNGKAANLVQKPWSAFPPEAPWSATPSSLEEETFPARATENWRGQFTRKYLLQTWTGEDAVGAEPAATFGGKSPAGGATGLGEPGYEPPKAGGGGFFPNPDNNYERDVLSRSFGKVVVARGKLPTSPETFENDGTWPALNSYQDRYTSFCMNESPRSTKVMACLYDEQIPVNSSRDYTIAISRAEDRPTNAVRFCGVAWIPWSKEGDGEAAPYTNENWGVLQMRTMLPNKSFTQAAQDVVRAGTDREVMGEYLPTVEYQAEKASFESSQGCSWANPGSPQIAAGSKTPNNGEFTLQWAASKEAAKVEGVIYTLQHKDASGGWETVASGLTKPEYAFDAGSPEGEGHWSYRVSATGEGAESEYSGPSSELIVDTTPAMLEISCPATAILDTPGITATVTASDEQSGLAQNPSGSYPIATNSLGEQTITETAVDNAGNETKESCTTDVIYGLKSLKPTAGKKVKPGNAVKVSFHLYDALGYVTDGSGTLEVAKEGDSYGSARSFVNMKHGLYEYRLNTTGLSVGKYTLRVNVSDGTSHTTSITIK